MLQSDSIPERLKTNDNHERLSTYTRNPYSTSERTPLHNPPFIRHNPQRQPVTQSIYPGNFSFTTEDERYQDSQSRVLEPTAIFHGIDRSRLLQKQQEEPRTPLNPS